KFLKAISLLTLFLLIIGQNAFAINPTKQKKKSAAVDQNSALAAHYLRRMGFGPSQKDLDLIVQIGPAAYIEKQLNPNSISDGNLEAMLPKYKNKAFNQFSITVQRWLLRMAYSQRQLQEKMTLFWHEYFSVSVEKVGEAPIIDHEALLRADCLTNFRQILTD